MNVRWVLIGILLTALASLLIGCSSGGDAPQPLTVDELVTRGQGQLESVTTNLMMNPSDARSVLRAAARDFAGALSQDAENTQAEMGYAVATTMTAFFDLIEVFPGRLDAILRDIASQHRATRGDGWTPLDIPTALASNYYDASPRGRASSVQTAQLRIISSTIPSMRQALPLFDALKTAADNGEHVRLRLYTNGRVQTVIFDTADIALVDAFANLVTALLNAAIAYNLDMPGGAPTIALPVDLNSNEMFDASEYLIASPFLDNFYPQGVSGCLQSLRYAAEDAQQGASLSGHTAGEYALVDVADPAVSAWLTQLGTSAATLEVACTSAVSTDLFFSDGVLRTINLPQLANITSLRPLMPSFQQSDLDAPGIWPDPTFRGAFVPGVPPDYLQLRYRDLEHGY